MTADQSSSQSRRQSPPVVHIARCEEHGIHGQRATCFACGGHVQQLPMVHVADLIESAQRNAEVLSALNVALLALGEARGHLTPGMRAGTSEACSVLDRAQSKIRLKLAEAGVA